MADDDGKRATTFVYPEPKHMETARIKVEDVEFANSQTDQLVYALVRWPFASTLYKWCTGQPPVEGQTRVAFGPVIPGLFFTLRGPASPVTPDQVAAALVKQYKWELTTGRRQQDFDLYVGAERDYVEAQEVPGHSGLAPAPLVELSSSNQLFYLPCRHVVTFRMCVRHLLAGLYLPGCVGKQLFNMYLTLAHFKTGKVFEGAGVGVGAEVGDVADLVPQLARRRMFGDSAAFYLTLTSFTPLKHEQATFSLLRGKHEGGPTVSQPMLVFSSERKEFTLKAALLSCIFSKPKASMAPYDKPSPPPVLGEAAGKKEREDDEKKADEVKAVVLSASPALRKGPSVYTVYDLGNNSSCSSISSNSSSSSCTVTTKTTRTLH
jgi:hypothetical protein